MGAFKSKNIDQPVAPRTRKEWNRILSLCKSSDILWKYQVPETELEQAKDIIDWDMVSRYQKLSKEFIVRYKNRINPDELSYNRHLTDELVEAFADDMIHIFIVCKNKKISAEAWNKIIMRPGLKFGSISFILENVKISEENLAKLSYLFNDTISEHQQLSETFIEKHTHQLNLNLICKYQKISLEFIEKNPKLIKWEYLSYNKHLTKDVAQAHREKLLDTEEVRQALA